MGSALDRGLPVTVRRDKTPSSWCPKHHAEYIRPPEGMAPRTPSTFKPTLRPKPKPPPAVYDATKFTTMAEAAGVFGIPLDAIHKARRSGRIASQQLRKGAGRY